MSKYKKNIYNKYSIIEKIGQGSFGEVFKINDNNGREFACKVEAKGSKLRLRGEAYIYKRFRIRNLNCVPIVYKYIRTPQYNLMIMQLLGESIDSLFVKNNRQLDCGTVMNIAINLISHFEQIHNVGIIHRDIKPNNFMFGLKEKKNKLYVMDFGLSKKWYNRKTKSHIEYKSGRSLIGTARYASLNIHMGIEPSRRDDMESLGYMLIYLVKGSLPWQGLKKKTRNSRIDRIGEKKMSVNLRELCEDLPECFYEYINYTRNLQFTETPDYKYLKELFIESANKNKIKLKYYWQ